MLIKCHGNHMEKYFATGSSNFATGILGLDSPDIS